MNLAMRETAEGLTIAIRVQPRASKNEVAGVMGEALKIRLTAPPVEGEANEACRRFLGEIFGVGRNNVEMVSGQTGRNKIFKIKGMTAIKAGEIFKKMGIE